MPVLSNNKIGNTMNNKLNMSLILVLFSLLVGCATTSDVENIQTQVTGLDTSIKQVSADAASAKSTAADAAAKSEAAEAAANRAAELSQEANNKLGNHFRRSMMK
jgi:outer membrane murein-binding lipoprotein Lpp